MAIFVFVFRFQCVNNITLYNLAMSFLESTFKDKLATEGSTNAVGHTGLVEVFCLPFRNWHEKLMSNYSSITNWWSFSDKISKVCGTKSRITTTKSWTLQGLWSSHYTDLLNWALSTKRKRIIISRNKSPILRKRNRCWAKW